MTDRHDEPGVLGGTFPYDSLAGREQARRIQQQYAVMPKATLEGFIQRLRRAEYAELPFDEIYAGVCDLLNYYYIVPKTICADGVWRARKGKAKRYFKNVSEVWYPQPHDVKKPGRLNAVGQNVFYCSSAIGIVVQEVRPAVGAWITLVRAVSKNAGVTNFDVIPLGMQRCNRSLLDDRSTPIRSNSYLRQLLGTKENFEKWCMVDDLFADLLSQEIRPGEEKRYDVTIALVKGLSYTPDIAGFLYPSIATELHGHNICLSPTATDEHFQPHRCDIYEVVGESAPGFDLEHVAYSSSIEGDGTIKWKDV